VPKYYSCEQVSQMLSVKAITVREWIRTGKLKAYKIGKMYRIDQSQIDEFVSSKTLNSNSK